MVKTHVIFSENINLPKPSILQYLRTQKFSHLLAEKKIDLHFQFRNKALFVDKRSFSSEFEKVGQYVDSLQLNPVS